VKVYNILGDVVRSFDTSTSSVQAKLRMAASEIIDISAVAKGIYFVEIKTDKEIVRKKIIKQ